MFATSLQSSVTQLMPIVLTLFIEEKSLSQFTLDTGMTSAINANWLSSGYICPHFKNIDKIILNIETMVAEWRTANRWRCHSLVNVWETLHTYV